MRIADFLRDIRGKIGSPPFDGNSCRPSGRTFFSEGFLLTGIRANPRGVLFSPCREKSTKRAPHKERDPRSLPYVSNPLLCATFRIREMSDCAESRGLTGGRGDVRRASSATPTTSGLGLHSAPLAELARRPSPVVPPASGCGGPSEGWWMSSEQARRTGCGHLHGPPIKPPPLPK